MAVKHPWVMAGIAFGFPRVDGLARSAILSVPSRRMDSVGRAVAELVWGCTSAAPAPRASAMAERNSLRPSAAQSVCCDCHSGHKGSARHSGGTICLIDQEAVFFCRKWGHSVIRQIGPLLAIEAVEGLLLDELVLITKGELRQRFDMLAGQLESARDEVRRRSPSSPGT